MAESTTNNAPAFPPGPWEWDEGGHSLRPVRACGDIASILEVESWGMIRRPQLRPLDESTHQIENARKLIAAVPDLYAAVQLALPILAQYSRIGYGNAAEALVFCRAAMAKAVPA